MRIATRISSGLVEVMRVMSMCGPMKNSSAGITRSPLELRITNFASSATSAGAVSDGLTATQRSVSNSACSRLTPSGVSA